HAVDASEWALVVTAKQVGVCPAKRLSLLSKTAGTKSASVGNELSPAARRDVSRRTCGVQYINIALAKSRNPRDFPCRLTVTGTRNAAEILGSSRTSRSSRRKR